MGLLNEINNVSRTLKDTQQKELTKKEEQELHQRLLLLLKKELVFCFEKAKNQNGVEFLVADLMKNKKDNINIIRDNYFDKYQKKLSVHDLNYLDEIYYKTILKFKKEFNEIFKEDTEKKKQLERQRKEEERQKEIQQKALNQEYIKRQKEKQIAFNNIIITLKTITLILASPFLLIIFFVWGICKNTK